MTTPATETEVLPPEGKSAIVLAIPERDALPPSLLVNIETSFVGFFSEAEKWRQQALSIQITSADQKPEMKLARTIRLALKEVRVKAEKKRVELKADALLMGKAIDGANNLLLAAIAPLEKHLKEQEEFAERLAEEQRQALIADRHEKLKPFLKEGQPLPPLDGMTEDQFTAFLADMKTLHEAHIASEKRIEAERIAREAAEAAEKERLRLENERLLREAAERDAAAKAEREAAEKAQREAAAKAKAEREALEAKAAAEKKAAEEKLAAERAAAEARAKADREKMQQEAREQAEKERQERAAIQAKADAERKAAEAKAQAERDAREKLEKEIAAKKAAEEAKAKAEAAAAKKAARAPDKDKIIAIAAAVRKLDVPTVTTPEGKAVLTEVTAKIESFAKWIETQASNL